MNKLVYLVCSSNMDCRKCPESDCKEIFEETKKNLQKFGEAVSTILAGSDVDIVKLRRDKRYERAVDKMQGNAFWIIKGGNFKKIEEELINGLLGVWAQK